MDRNRPRDGQGVGLGRSLSARRAWIEIHVRPMIVTSRPVALRKESVDRNQGAAQVLDAVESSLSARRAWIEIHLSIIL